MALLTLDDLSLAFRGVHVLDKVSRFVESGEKIGLLGRNGTGKTTLLRMIAGDQEPDAGTCVLASGKRASFLPQEVPGDLSGQVFGLLRGLWHLLCASTCHDFLLCKLLFELFYLLLIILDFFFGLPGLFRNSNKLFKC